MIILTSLGGTWAVEENPYSSGDNNLGGNPIDPNMDNTTKCNTKEGNDTYINFNSVSLTFNNVLYGGNTEVTPLITLPEELPTNFNVLDSTFMEISTTAQYSGSINISYSYVNLNYQNESNLKLLHYENDEWVDCTTYIDTINKIIYGSVNSLSPFAVISTADEELPDDPGTDDGNQNDGTDDGNQNDGTDEEVDDGNDGLPAVTTDEITDGVVIDGAENSSNENTVDMIPTGAPALPLLLGILMILSGLLKRR